MFVTSESTAARIAANRANAAQSTGPRTAKGKSVSSKNATSHGLYSATIVVHYWEPQAEFDLLRQQYHQRFQPNDRVETDIIDRLVDSARRRARVISIETTLFDLEIEEMNGEIERTYSDSEDGLLRVARAFRNRHGDGVWDAIQRHLTSIDRASHRALRDLRLVQGDRFDQIAASAPAKAEPQSSNTLKIAERSQLTPVEVRTPAVDQPKKQKEMQSHAKIERPDEGTDLAV